MPKKQKTPKNHDIDDLFNVVDMQGQMSNDDAANMTEVMKTLVTRLTNETDALDWLKAEEIPAPIKLPRQFFKILREVHKQNDCCGLDVADLGASLLNSLVLHALGCFVSAIELQDKLSKDKGVESEYRVSSKSIQSILDTIG